MSQLKPFFPLTHHFFGLTYKYKKPLLEELYVCFQYVKIPYETLMTMPTWERRFYMNIHSENVEKQNEARNSQQKTNGGKGTRSKSISGNALKHQMKNNKIPD